MTENDFSSQDEVEIDLDALGFGDDIQQPTSDDEINLDFADFSEEESDSSNTQIDLDVLADEQPTQENSAEETDEPDSPQDIELANRIAQLRHQLYSQPGDWYVVNTYSGMENKVKQNLEARIVTQNVEDDIYEVIVPTEDIVEMRNGQRKTITRVFMPGYVLVRMDLTPEAWSTVRGTPSVTALIGQNNQPVPLSIDEVERMLTPGVSAEVAKQFASQPKKPRKVEVADYAVGDVITVVDGPFTGVHGTISEINVHSQRLKANVDIMGRETPLDLTFQQIQKVV